MDTLLEKFAKLGCDNAPGQEGRQKAAALELRGEKPVDFSHGDVDAHPPIPGTLADFVAGVEKIGGHQAYTEYRGGKSTREDLARKISAFTGAAIDPEENIILTPGTQGALFLAIGANMVPGDKVAIVEASWSPSRWTISALRTRGKPAWTCPNWSRPSRTGSSCSCSPTPTTPPA